jgi:hypothetical protein
MSQDRACSFLVCQSNLICSLEALILKALTKIGDFTLIKPEEYGTIK